MGWSMLPALVELWAQTKATGKSNARHIPCPRSACTRGVKYGHIRINQTWSTLSIREPFALAALPIPTIIPLLQNSVAPARLLHHGASFHAVSFSKTTVFRSPTPSQHTSIGFRPAIKRATEPFTRELRHKSHFCAPYTSSFVYSEAPVHPLRVP